MSWCDIYSNLERPKFRDPSLWRKMLINSWGRSLWPNYLLMTPLSLNAITLGFNMSSCVVNCTQHSSWWPHSRRRRNEGLWGTLGGRTALSLYWVLMVCYLLCRNPWRRRWWLVILCEYDSPLHRWPGWLYIDLNARKGASSCHHQGIETSHFRTQERVQINNASFGSPKFSPLLSSASVS